MKIATIVPIIASLIALGAATVVFSSGSTPYKTVAEARKMTGDRINLGVEVDKKSVHRSLESNHLEFDAKDRDGTKIHVRHEGELVDLSKADRVTCVGKLVHDDKINQDIFVSQQILVKCPSKYEEENSKK